MTAFFDIIVLVSYDTDCDKNDNIIIIIKFVFILETELFKMNMSQCLLLCVFTNPSQMSTSKFFIPASLKQPAGQDVLSGNDNNSCSRTPNNNLIKLIDLKLIILPLTKADMSLALVKHVIYECANPEGWGSGSWVPSPSKKSHSYMVSKQYWSGSPEKSQSYEDYDAILVHHRPDSKTPFLNGVSMADRWWPVLAAFGSSLPSSTEKIKQKELDPLWTKLSGTAHVLRAQTSTYKC